MPQTIYGTPATVRKVVICQDHSMGKAGRIRALCRALRDDLKLAIREHPELATCFAHDIQRASQLLK